MIYILTQQIRTKKTTNIQIKNPSLQSLYLGVSAKKKFRKACNEKTFYGVGVTESSGDGDITWYLDGKYCSYKKNGPNGEKLIKNDDVHTWWNFEEIELDIIFNGKVHNGTLKICRVPKKGVDNIVITKINNGGNTDGFVLNLVLCKAQIVRVYQIAEVDYGMELELD